MSVLDGMPPCRRYAIAQRISRLEEVLHFAEFDGTLPVEDFQRIFAIPNYLSAKRQVDRLRHWLGSMGVRFGLDFDGLSTRIAFEWRALWSFVTRESEYALQVLLAGEARHSRQELRRRRRLPFRTPFFPAS